MITEATKLLMNLKPLKVESSQIAQIGYDLESETAYIEFKNSGSIYRYDGVSEIDFNALETAQSVGKHFGSVFKPKYQNACTRLV